jgi:hypothetical protein
MKNQILIDSRARETRRLRRRIKDGRRFINIKARKSRERTLRQKRALEYLLSPGDPSLYHDQEAMADALRTIADQRRTR